MSEQRVISLPAAILININIMLGAGIFLNTVKLAGPAGALGALGYLLVGILMLPLVFSIAKLTGMHPDGGFYAFGKHEISTFAGFVSAWSYFIGKLASGALMIHFSLALAQELIPLLQHVHLLVLDAFVIIIFVLLNMLNLKAGSKIQAAFTVLKLIPISFAIFVGLFLFDGGNLAPQYQLWSGLPDVLPFLFYATMGFEAACLLCGKIKNPKKNAPRAILFSYAIALTIAALYQLFFYGAVGPILSKYAPLDAGYLYAFPALLAKLLPNTPLLAGKLRGILHLALASSALGGAYGIMFSNTWNLHTLAKNGHLIFKNLFTKLNKYSIPIFCVLIKSLIYAAYLLVSGGLQDALQVLSSFGVVLAYTISVVALLTAKIKRPNIPVPIALPALGLASCSIFIATSLKNLMQKGFYSLLLFLILLGLGVLMFLVTQKKGRTCS